MNKRGDLTNVPSHLESEFRLRSRTPIPIALVDAVVREAGARCLLAESRRHRDTYLDDDRRALLAGGVGFRLREDRRGRHLGCKPRGQPGPTGLFVRLETEEPWPSPDLPRFASELPERLRDIVEPYVLDRPIAAGLALEVQREIRQLERDGHELCELAVDHVKATAAARTVDFDELEIEVLDDLPGCERLAEQLAERLSLTPATADKPSHAAALLALEPRPVVLDRPDAAGTFGDAVLWIARRQLAAMRAAEVGVRCEGRPEHLHAMRVAIRRLRSLVRSCRDLWSQESLDRLRTGLGETARQLGQLRDLDVLLEQLPATIDALPAALRRHGERTLDWIRRQREATCARLLAWLRSRSRLASARAIEDDLEAFDRGSAAAQTAVTPAAVPRLAKLVRKMRKLVDGLPPDLPIGPVHRLRIAAKRVRYLAEDFAGFPGIDCGKSLRAVVRVQQALGVICDHEVATERLLGWVGPATADCGDPAIAAVLGGLAARQAEAASGARQAAASSLRRIGRRKIWRDFPGCLDAPPA